MGKKVISNKINLDSINSNIIESLKNNPLILLTSLSIIIASLTKTFETVLIFQFAIASTMGFFSALIISIIKSFIKKNFFIDFFFISMIFLGFIFIAGVLGVFISSTWGGNVYSKIVFSILFFFAFIIYLLLDVSRYNFFKKQKIKFYCVIILIQIFVFTIGFTLILIAFGGQIIAMFGFGGLSLFKFFSELMLIGVTIFAGSFFILPYPFFCSVERECLGMDKPI